MRNDEEEEEKEEAEKYEEIFFEFLLTHISGTACAIFKFGLWPRLGGGHLHCKFGAIRPRDHGATDTRKPQVCCSCQYTHYVCARPVSLGRTTHYRVS